MQRALESRGFISAVLAMATGMFLFYTHPFPDDQIFLRVIAMRAPQAFLSFKYLYNTLLFSSPYLACSTMLSGLYILTLKGRCCMRERRTATGVRRVREWRGGVRSEGNRESGWKLRSVVVARSSRAETESRSAA